MCVTINVSHIVCVCERERGTDRDSTHERDYKRQIFLQTNTNILCTHQCWEYPLFVNLEDILYIKSITVLCLLKTFTVT
jgi:hypothetical protein